MKAIILAGGHATRLWPLTKNRAKPLLPLAGKPIIAYMLDQLQAMDVDNILISTNAKYADDFRQFAEEYGYDLEVVVEDHTSEEEKIGSLGAIIQVIEEYGDDDYLVVGGDNYTSLDLAEFTQFAEDCGTPTIACYEVDTLDDAKPFGVVDVDDTNQVTGFTEKPENPPSQLVSTLFYYFPETSMEMFDEYVAAYEDTDSNYLDEPGRLIEWAYSQYPMSVFSFEGDWYDIGNPENYLRAQRALADTTNNGEVIDSTIGENVWVMEGATVKRSDLNNCIVFSDATILDCELDNVIIDERATVSGKQLGNSTIGAHSTVQ